RWGSGIRRWLLNVRIARKRTSVAHVAKVPIASQLLPTAPQQFARLFDNRVGAQQQGRGHVEAKRPGGLEVDYKLELGRLHDRQIGWLLALEYSPSVLANLAIHIRYAAAVAYQPTGLDIFTHCKYCGNCIACR